MYSDYIITVDENGEPYIAHAFGIGSWIKRVVKYDKKEPDGKGGWRYYYNTAKRKAGTAAKKAWGSKAGRWIDSHDAGITERIMANRLSRKSKKASRKGYNDDAMAYSKRSAELRRESKSEREAAKEAIKRLLSRNSDKKVVNLGEYTVVYPNPDTMEQNPDKTEQNRPSSHQKKVTGIAEKGSIYKRGEGLGTKLDSPVHGSFRQDSKTELNKDPKADSSAYYAKREDEASIRKQEREFAKLDDRWRNLIREQSKIRNSSEVKNAWERYSRYIDKYGKNSSQAKWAEQEYIKVTKPIRDIEEELRVVWEQRNHQPYPR